jgi:capsular polysaccharide biosynthesis protein
MVSDGERTATASVNASDDAAQPLPRVDDLPAAELPGEEYSTGLPGLRLVRAALRRSVWLWATTAAIGLIIGVGLYVKHPAYQATTSIVLVPNPAEVPTDAILTDIALAQSQAVAGRAVQKLGLRQSAGSFLSSYKVIPLTDRVIQITLTAPSSSLAVTRAQAVATAFLSYRAQQAQAQLQHTLSSLQQQVTQAKQQIQAMGNQIGRLSAQPASPAQQALVSKLRAQRSLSESQLPALQQAVTANQVSARLTMTQLVQGSQVLDPASPKSPSHVKKVVEYIGGGLFAGLVLGMGLVILRVLVSDRLRWRDDVAHALGVPVRLSVGPVHARRWPPGRGGLAAAQDRNVQRIVAHLRDAVPQGSRRAAALAVVPIDDASVAALGVAALAVSCAQQGQQVVLADLCHGAPAARLLGVTGPGVATASADGAHLVVAVPSDTDAPAGPLSRSSPGEPSPELAEAYASSDLLLTVARLDPSLGGEHLATWAGGAVVMVTAGRSSWAKIHAAGEMIRLAGTPLISAVLVGADKDDESLGVAHAPAPPAAADPGPRIPGR